MIAYKGKLQCSTVDWSCYIRLYGKGVRAFLSTEGTGQSQMKLFGAAHVQELNAQSGSCYYPNVFLETDFFFMLDEVICLLALVLCSQA